MRGGCGGGGQRLLPGADPTFLPFVRTLLNASCLSPLPQPAVSFVGGGPSCSGKAWVCVLGRGCCGTALVANNASLFAAFADSFMTGWEHVRIDQSGVLKRATAATCNERHINESDCVSALDRHNELCMDWRHTNGSHCITGVGHRTLFMDPSDAARLGVGPSVLRTDRTLRLDHPTATRVPAAPWSLTRILSLFVPILMGELGAGPKVHALWVQAPTVSVPVLVVERWENLAMHQHEALPGAIDDLMYRVNITASAGLAMVDLKTTDILVRRRPADGTWETRVNDFDVPYAFASRLPARGNMLLTLMPLAMSFACASPLSRLPVASALADAVAALASEPCDRNHTHGGETGWGPLSTMAVTKKFSDARNVMRSNRAPSEQCKLIGHFAASHNFESTVRCVGV